MIAPRIGLQLKKSTGKCGCFPVFSTMVSRRNGESVLNDPTVPSPVRKRGRRLDASRAAQLDLSLAWFFRALLKQILFHAVRSPSSCQGGLVRAVRPAKVAFRQEILDKDRQIP
ncbi:hypothetical protein OA90_05600 [Labrenzia sp. OB1]|nr:hypothetical protein OA90_05600 [Labrenzia sp. OB1]